jgi:hypothetical protein
MFTNPSKPFDNLPRHGGVSFTIPEATLREISNQSNFKQSTETTGFPDPFPQLNIPLAVGVLVGLYILFK